MAFEIVMGRLVFSPNTWTERAAELVLDVMVEKLRFKGLDMFVLLVVR